MKKNAVSSGPAISRKTGTHSPEVGMRFFESKPPHHVWIISKVYTPPASQLLHVLLDRCGKFPASKLLSVEAMRDTSFFKKDRRDPFEGAAADAQKRRYSDPFTFS